MSGVVARESDLVCMQQQQPRSETAACKHHPTPCSRAGVPQYVLQVEAAAAEPAAASRKRPAAEVDENAAPRPAKKASTVKAAKPAKVRVPGMRASSPQQKTTLVTSRPPCRRDAIEQ